MATRPRLFFAAMPSPGAVAAWQARLAEAGVLDLLGRRVFAPGNWHQTLSGRHFDPDADVRRRLLQAGDAIGAEACTLRFNRVGWSGHPEGGRTHCTLLSQGRPKAFDSLLAATQAGLATVGLGDGEGHTPHVTLSYDAGDIHPTRGIVPIEWTLDTLLLLEGHGRPYRYDLLARWPLRTPPDPRHQVDLFAPG